MHTDNVPGYDLGGESISDAPIDDEAFDRLKRSVMFTEEDEAYLEQAGGVLEGQTDEILDVWYGFVGDHDFLIHYVTDGEGNPDEEYLGRV